MDLRKCLAGCLGLRATECARRELTLGHTIDPVVEEQQVDVDVTTASVNEVVATECGAVTVAGNHPNGEVRIGQLNACSSGSSAAVNTMETVSVHVIWET